MGSLDQIARQRRAGGQAAPATGGTLDQIAAHRSAGGTGIPDNVDGTGGIPKVAAPPADHHGGGGILGTIEHGAHWTAGKIGLAAHDVKTIPGGVYDLVNTEQHILRWRLTHPTGNFNDPGPNGPGKWGRHATELTHGMEQGAVQAVEHPLRDPFQTALTVLPVVSGAGSVAARAGAVGRAAAEGGTVADLARAAAATPEVQPRLISVGDTQVSLHPSANPAVRAVQGLHDRVVQHGIDANPEGRVAAYGTKRVGGSLAETARYQQRLRDVPAQMLEKAAKRLAPTGHRVPGTGANRFQRVEQAALELTSVNTAPRVAAAYHLGQARKGVEPEMNRAVAKLYQAVDKRGLLTQNEHGDVIVNASGHPKLAQADVQLAHVQGRGDQILARYGVRSADELQAAVNAPGRYRAGATYEKPTPAKAGVPSQSLLKARARVTRLEALHERAVAKATARATPYGNVHTRTGYVKQNLKSAPEAALKRQHVEVPANPPRGTALPIDQLDERIAKLDARAAQTPIDARDSHEIRRAAEGAKVLRAIRDEQSTGRGGRTPGVPSDLPARGINTPTVERLGGALSVARDDLARLEQQAANRVQPTGIIGGDQARPGRGHVSYAGSEPKAPKNAAASAASPVVGEARAPITSHANEGVNISKGVVPNDITGQAARHFHQIVRFVNTTEHRNQAVQTGSDVRRTSRDVLVKVPGAEHAKIPAAVNEILGKSKVTHDDVEGINAALQAYKEDMVPGLRDRFAADRQAGIGTPAPEGHRWVDRNILGDLAKPGTGPRGRIARSVDTINSAVTAATVYFKIGHVGTRVLTNTTTNIIQGSARPVEIAKSVELWKGISEEDRLRALAASGQHGFQSMPHEGQNWVGRAAGRGANWWAKHADSVFRFNSIAYEARKAGFDTPAKFHDLLDRLERPQDFHMNAAEHAKVDWVAKRANREGIAYDRLNEFERRYLTRAVWFYPWLRGTVGFAGNTLLEHPYKSAVLGAAGVHGRQLQEQQLGDLPSYEAGLLKLGGSADKPTVADFSTFSPFSTPADIAQAVARPGELSGFLNPAATAGTNLIFGLDQYGNKSTSPIRDAAASLFAPTPEAQILTAFLQRGQDQGRRMFPKSPDLYGTRDPLIRALVGPGTPRRLNVSAAHRTAGRERAGR